MQAMARCSLRTAYALTSACCWQLLDARTSGMVQDLVEEFSIAWLRTLADEELGSTDHEELITFLSEGRSAFVAKETAAAA